MPGNPSWPLGLVSESLTPAESGVWSGSAFQTWVWNPVLPPWIWYVGALAANSTCFPSKMNLAPHRDWQTADDGARTKGAGRRRRVVVEERDVVEGSAAIGDFHGGSIAPR